MTNPTTSTAIRAQLAENAAALGKAREDAALFERLKAAAALATKLAKRGDELTEALAKAQDAEAKAEDDALFAKYGGITVTGKTPDNQEPSAIGTNWTITYKRLASGKSGSPVMVEHSCNGFEALDPYTYYYLVNRHPEQIPEPIKALAPDDIHAAFKRYFVARKRGYLSGN